MNVGHFFGHDKMALLFCIVADCFVKTKQRESEQIISLYSNFIIKLLLMILLLILSYITFIKLVNTATF